MANFYDKDNNFLIDVHYHNLKGEDVTKQFIIDHISESSEMKYVEEINSFINADPYEVDAFDDMANKQEYMDLWFDKHQDVNFDLWKFFWNGCPHKDVIDIQYDIYQEIKKAYRGEEHTMLLIPFIGSLIDNGNDIIIGETIKKYCDLNMSKEEFDKMMKSDNIEVGKHYICIYAV